MNGNTETSSANHIQIAAGIVVSYVANNSVRSAELPTLISSVHSALSSLGQGSRAEVPTVEKPTDAQIRKSVTPNALISFIDGKPYKTLKRHLTKHGLDPQSYRARYGLPRDYPTVAPSYSEMRSALAKSAHFGNQREAGLEGPRNRLDHHRGAEGPRPEEGR